MTERPTPDERAAAEVPPEEPETEAQAGPEAEPMPEAESAPEVAAEPASAGSGDADGGKATSGVTKTPEPDADTATTDVEVTDDLQAAADALEVDLDLLLSERAEYLDAYRRAQADFENYRKQAQKRQEEAVVRALGSFVEKLLPVLDACDAALAHGASEVEPILTALYGALGKEGLERLDPKGMPFDPAEAEAVVHEPGEGGDQVVSEVLRAGYRWRGRVLRPAMVKVTG